MFSSNRPSISRGSPRVLAALAVAALAGLAANAAASTISWGTATNISGDTDVSTLGSLVVANDIGYQDTSQTVNGVTFSPFTATSGSATVTQGNVTLSAPTNGDGVEFDSGFGPSNFGASYDAMLNGAAALGNGSTATNGLDPMDLTISPDYSRTGAGLRGWRS